MAQGQVRGPRVVVAAALMFTPDAWPLWIVAGLVAVGHLAICLGANNYVHGSPYPWTFVRLFTHLDHAILFLGWGTLGLWLWAAEGNLDRAWQLAGWPARLYALVAIGAAVIPLPWWVIRQVRSRQPAALVSNHSRIVDIPERLGRAPRGRGLSTVLTRLPGNQVFHLEVNEKRLALPRLPSALAGLTITHLSDLHFTGNTHQDYYHEVIREANALEGDVAVICGDVVDTLDCLDWVPEILAALRAPLGAYFVLGNHDLRTRDVPRVRRALVGAGLVDLGGHWRLLEARGWPLVIAGNELPYLGPAADLSGVPAEVAGRRPFRLLVAHTPDQLPWARRFDVDLMLAGHMHGGQIRVPGLGAVVGPSRQGVRYASGVFHEPPTVLHVSRGISAMTPLRYNCPPELSRLVLEPAVAPGDAAPSR